MYLSASAHHGDMILTEGDDVLVTPVGSVQGNIFGYVFNVGGILIIEDAAQITGKAVHVRDYTRGRAYPCRDPRHDD